MILIHHIIQEIIDIDTCTGIYDRLDLIQKLGDYTEEEIRLVRIKFLSEMAN